MGKFFHHPKGSPEARAYMARLRAMRGKRKRNATATDAPLEGKERRLSSGTERSLGIGPTKAHRVEVEGWSYGVPLGKMVGTHAWATDAKIPYPAPGYYPPAENPQLLVLGNPGNPSGWSPVGSYTPAELPILLWRLQTAGIRYQIKPSAITPGNTEVIVPSAKRKAATKLSPRRQQPNPRRGAPLALGATWTEEKFKPKGAFDPRSFRYKRIPAKGPLKAYLLLGCPKGYWHPASQRCEIAQEAHVVMRPGRRVVALPSRRVAANPGACPPGVPPWMWADPWFQAEIRAFRRRHGPRKPIEISKVQVPKGFPKFMSVYGAANHAVYDAPKGSSKGKRIHHFGRRGRHKPWLVSSTQAGPKFLAFVGGSFKARPDWIYD